MAINVKFAVTVLTCSEELNYVAKVDPHIHNFLTGPCCLHRTIKNTESESIVLHPNKVSCINTSTFHLYLGRKSLIISKYLSSKDSRQMEWQLVNP